SPGESQHRACLRPCRLLGPIPRLRVGLKRADEISAYGRYLLDGGEERAFVCFRWFIEATDLAHELQCGCADLLFRHGRIKIEQGSDISAHTLCSDRPPAPCGPRSPRPVYFLRLNPMQ